MRKKSYFITILLCLVTLLFATEFTFAGNVGRAVYGVFTEIYNGVGKYASAGDDYLNIWRGGTTNDIYSIDKIEGKKSFRLDGSAWASFAFNSNQNMNAYSGGRIYFSLKYPNGVDNNKGFIKLEDAVSAKPICFDSNSIIRIDDGSTQLGTGVENDGAWHTYYIELSNFVDLGISLSNIKCPLILSSELGSGEFFLADNVYWTKAPTEARSFNVTVKNISDNQVLTGDDEKITWAQSCFRQSWTAAEQYIELDLDYECTNNWYVKIYLNNGDATRKGLYCIDSDESEIVLPMAWRVSRDLLPTSSGDTLQVKKDSEGKLYDSGKIHTDPAWSYSWAYFYDISDESLVLNDATVWNARGCHTFFYNENEAWDSFVTNNEWLTDYYEKKPKIYFAADCSTAIGGLTFEANVITELFYE